MGVELVFCSRPPVFMDALDSMKSLPVALCPGPAAGTPGSLALKEQNPW